MPETSLGRRSIGEILLEHGYVTKEQVEEATALQSGSDRPLGQILVEAGSITRLELASALAEQWSDSGAPIGPPEGLSLSGSVPALEPFGPPAPRAPAFDQSELIARLDALEEALQKRSATDDEALDDKAELQAAVEAVSQRLANVAEPAIEELGSRLSLLAAEENRAGQFEQLARTVQELREQLAWVAQTADSVAQRSDQSATDTAAALATIREEISAVSAKMPSLADGEEVERLHALVDALTQRPVRDPDLVAQIEDLQAVVEALGQRPVRDPDLAAQIEDLQAVVESLGQRSTRDPDLVAQIEDLQAVVEALGKRPTRDVELSAQVNTLALRLAELADHVDVLGGSVQSVSGDADALHELQGALAELAQRPLADPASEQRLAELAQGLEELARRPASDPAAEQRIADLAAQVAELAERPAADPALEQRIAELATQVADLSQRPAADPALEQRVEELSASVAELAQRPASDPAAEQRVEELASALQELRASMETLAAKPAGDPELDETLFELTSRLAELERADLLADVRAQLEELAARPVADPSLVQRLAELESRVERVPGDDVLESLESGDRSLGFRIDGVVARIDEVAAALERVGGSEVPREAWDEAVAVLNSRMDVEREFDNRLAEVETRIAQIATNGGSPSAGPVASDSELAAQLAALSAKVDHLAAGGVVSQTGDEAEDGTASTATPATLERDVEHVLMAIERLSVHLGAHERALTELMGASGVVAQVRELGARVGDLETYGGGGSGTGGGSGAGEGELRAELRSLMRRLEEAETSQKQDRERVIEQLEKAAGAIDWRLQRLESVRSDDPT
jgi:hypothetical protein